jgi:hypothetical protein
MYLARYIFVLDALLGSKRTTPFQKRSLSSVPNTTKLSETEGPLLTDETVRFTGIQTRPKAISPIVVNLVAGADKERFLVLQKDESVFSSTYND